MKTFLLWLILLTFCWPLAIAALILYPLVWLVLIPFKLIAISVHGILEIFSAVIRLPARILKASSGKI